MVKNYRILYQCRKIRLRNQVTEVTFEAGWKWRNMKTNGEICKKSTGSSICWRGGETQCDVTREKRWGREDDGWHENLVALLSILRSYSSWDPPSLLSPPMSVNLLSCHTYGKVLTVVILSFLRLSLVSSFLPFFYLKGRLSLSLFPILLCVCFGFVASLSLSSHRLLPIKDVNYERRESVNPCDYEEENWGREVWVVTSPLCG